MPPKSGRNVTVDKDTGNRHFTDWDDNGKGWSGRVSWDEDADGNEVSGSFHMTQQSTPDDDD